MTILVVIIGVLILMDFVSIHWHVTYANKLGGVINWINIQKTNIADIENSAYLLNELEVNIALIKTWIIETNKFIVPGLFITEAFTVYAGISLLYDMPISTITLNIIAISQAGVMTALYVMTNRIYRSMNITRTITAEVMALTVVDKIVDKIIDNKNTKREDNARNESQD